MVNVALVGPYTTFAIASTLVLLPIATHKYVYGIIYLLTEVATVKYRP